MLYAERCILRESFAHIGFFLHWQSFCPERLVMQGIISRMSAFAEEFCCRCMAGFMMSTSSVRLILTMGGEWDSNGDRLMVMIVLTVVYWVGLSADAQTSLV